MGYDVEGCKRLIGATILHAACDVALLHGSNSAEYWDAAKTLRECSSNSWGRELLDRLQSSTNVRRRAIRAYKDYRKGDGMLRVKYK